MTKPGCRFPLLVLAATIFPLGASAAPDASALQSFVRGNLEQIHKCFRKELAVDRKRGGTLFVEITFGKNLRPQKTTIVKSDFKNSAMHGCLTALFSTMPVKVGRALGVDAGAAVQVPLVFKGDPRKYTVSMDDVRGLAEKDGGVPLLTAKNSGAKRVTMALVKTNGGYFVAREPPDQLYWVLKGHGKLRVGVHPKQRHTPFKQGQVIWFPPQTKGAMIAGSDAIHLLEIRIKSTVKPRGSSKASPQVLKTKRVLRLAKGKLRVLPIIHAANSKQKRFYLGLLDAEAGLSVPEHSHLGAVESLFVQTGQGKMAVSGHQSEVGPSQAIYIAENRGHWLKVAKKIRALQIYAPAGAEQRFFKAAKKK